MAAKDSSGTCDGTFFPYEKMGYDTNAWTSRRLDSIKQWVALEKVHGANFSFTVHASRGEIGNARAARRTGFLKEGENFYNLKNNQRFLEVEGERARRLFGAVRDRHCSDAASVTVFGELFGGMRGSCNYTANWTSLDERNVPRPPQVATLIQRLLWFPMQSVSNARFGTVQISGSWHTMWQSHTLTTHKVRCTY